VSHEPEEVDGKKDLALSCDADRARPELCPFRRATPDLPEAEIAKAVLQPACTLGVSASTLRRFRDYCCYALKTAAPDVTLVGDRPTGNLKATERTRSLRMSGLWQMFPTGTATLGRGCLKI
jgi:hypothetical protein